MAENIEIKVEDKVSPSISTKLRTIATEARTADGAVKNLQNQLAQLNAGNLNVILQNATAATRAINNTALASQRLATEQQRTATAAAQAAAAQTRATTAQEALATATARTATAQQQTATAAQRLATEQARTATATAQAAAAEDRAAIAALRLQQAQEKAAQAGDKMAREAEALKRSLYPLYDAQQAHNAAVQQALKLYKAGAIDVKTYTDAVNRSTEQMEAARIGQNALNNGLVKTAKGSQLARHHLVNLGFQIQDIGVSLASGQNPLTVFIQQGAQIGGIAAQAGVGLGAMAKAVGALLLPFLPLVAALGVAVGAFKLFQSEVNKSADLKKYAESLGATQKQIKQLDLDTVTFTDTMKGLWATIDERTGAGDLFGGLWESTKKTFKNILGYIALSVQSIVALIQATGDVISEVFARIPSPVKKIMAEVTNVVIGYFEGMANAAIDAVNLIIAGLNKISTVQIDPFEKVTFDRLPTEFADASGKELSDIFVDSYVTNLENNKAATSKFIADWMKNTEQAARSRVQKSLEEANADKTAKTAESRAAALAKVNAQLDNELARIGMLQPAREAQQKFDQIEEQLLGKKITLTKQEADALKEKIATIQQAAIVQQEFDRIYEDAVGPQRTYNASLEAAQKLLDMGAISQEHYARAVTMANEAFANAQDPLRQYNKDLQQQFELLTMLPKQREVEQQIMQVQNDLLSKGIVLNEQELTQLRERLTLLQQVNAVSQQEATLLDNSVGKRQAYIDQLTAINNLLKNPDSGFTRSDALTAIGGTEAGQYLAGSPEMIQAQVDQLGQAYEQIDALRQQDLISEQTAAAAKMQIWNAQQNAQLSTAKTFFSSLEGLQSSNNRKLAAIGKAAAITNAVINTYQSATGAYAAMASIPYVGPVLGAAAAAAAIAAGMANVAQIRSQQTGFREGGYTGSIGVNEVAGVVHGQEFVMDAATTARVGVANLEALRSGAAQVSQNSNNGTQAAPQGSAPVSGENGGNVGNTTNVRMITVLDPAMVGDYLSTPEGEQVFVNTIRRNSDVVKQALQNG